MPEATELQLPRIEPRRFASGLSRERWAMSWEDYRRRRL